MDKFSEWLIGEIKQRGWSQSDLARASGLTRQVISYYLVGESKSPNPEALRAIASALKLPPETVFRAAGILPPASDDPWADEMAFKLAELDPAKRAMAERLIQALAEQEEAEKTKTLKAKRSTG